MSDTVTFPAVFTPGFMGFATETEFMLDFTASMRDSGLKSYARTYAELVAKQNRPMAQPTNFVPTVVKPSEGGESPTGGNGNGATYDGPKDLNYGEHAKKFGKVPGTRSGRGFVHAMSDAQKRFILSLLSTKDTTVLANNMVRGWTLNPNEIDSISKQHARPFIDALLSCPNKSVTAVKGDSDSGKKELNGSARQIEWITKGLNGKASLLSEKGFTSETDIRDLFTQHNYSAKSVIDALLKMSRKVSAKSSEATNKVEITEGMYKMGERIFKVYLNRANTCLLVKELIDGSFEYVGSAQWKLPKGATRMTLDEAKAYGQLTGTCCVCSRKLTDESSIAAGIGPICEGKF